MATLDDILEPLVALELRPRDVCRLRRVCRALRVQLGRPRSGRSWRKSFPSKHPLASRRSMRSPTTTTTSSMSARRTTPSSSERATPRAGHAEGRRRVAAVNMQACFMERPSLRADGLVDVGQFDDTAGPILWIGLVVHRNSLAPERERMLDEGTLEETLLLRAVDLSGRTAGAFRSRSLMERFLASKWASCARLQRLRVGPRRRRQGHGLPVWRRRPRHHRRRRDRQGHGARQPRGAHHHRPPALRAVAREHRPPARLYPIIHLTDIQRAKPVGGEAEITRVGFGRSLR